MQNRFEITSILGTDSIGALVSCLQALYRVASEYKSKQPYRSGVPADIMHLLAQMHGQPSITEFETAVRDGRLPDYFRGCPIKVTTEYCDAEGSRIDHRVKLDVEFLENGYIHPTQVPHVYIGRLDLFDRDNGGPGSALRALSNL